jgi:hypothetical protein
MIIFVYLMRILLIEQLHFDINKEMEQTKTWTYRIYKLHTFLQRFLFMGGKVSFRVIYMYRGCY